MFRIGIIGLGAVVEAHLAGFAMLQDLSVVSVCDSREEVARNFAERLGAAAYVRHEDLIAAGGIDLIMVLTPASTHRSLVEAAAAAKIPVFCEKPLAVTMADGEAMLEACRVAGVPLFYGASYRYLPALTKAREIIRSGAIGKVQLLTEHLIGGNGLAGYRQLAPIHYPPGGPGGASMGLVDHGVHLIDIFSWLLGEQPVTVVGSGQISGEPAQTEFVAMTFPSGASGHLLYNAATYSSLLPNEGIFSGGQGWLASGEVCNAGGWESEPGSISIYGTTGALRVFHYANALFMNDGSGPRRIDLTGRPAFGHFATQLEACMATLRNGVPPVADGGDGLRALQTLLAVYGT